MSEKWSKYSARNSVGWSRSSKFTGVVNVFVGILFYSPCIWFIQFWLVKSKQEDTKSFTQMCDNIYVM